MIIAVPKERRRGETRVAASPETVRKIVSWGMTIRIEKDAGLAAGFSNEAYLDAGAEITASPEDTYRGAGIILKIWAPLPEEEKLLAAGMTIISNFEILSNKDRLESFSRLGTTCFALDLMPRISRAQSMDILSSQSNLAGYKAVIEAVNASGKAVPLMMTAAGTIPPVKVLVLGAGVAGLQAIATAKRLGAQVFAADVRPQVKEQVESLGGRFIDVATAENFETNGGYATETSEDYQRKQKEAVAEQLKKTDIAITTALIPGRPAPRLISRAMIDAMPAGAVIVDMASSSGGNVEGSEDGATVITNGVTIIGNSNLAAGVPSSASALFARNIINFIAPMYSADSGQIVFDFEDELVRKTCICKDGKLTGVVLK